MLFRVFVVGGYFALTALGLLGCTGSTDSTVHLSLPSIVVSQPTSQTVTAGQTATFSVEATGAAPLSYQWQRNRTAISGATSSSYTTAATTSSDNGAQFTVMVNNPAGASPATPLRSQSLRQCQASVSHQPPLLSEVKQWGRLVPRSS